MKLTNPKTSLLLGGVASALFSVTSSYAATTLLEDDFNNVDNLTWSNVGTIADNLGALNYAAQGNFMTTIDLQPGNEYVMTLDVSINNVGGNPYLMFGFMNPSVTAASRHNNNSPSYIQFTPEAPLLASKSGATIFDSITTATETAFATSYTYKMVMTTAATGTTASVDFFWINNATTTETSLGSQSIADYTLATYDSIGVSGDFRGTTANGSIDNFLVTVEAIPEPSAALLGGFGLLALLRRRRA